MYQGISELIDLMPRYVCGPNCRSSRLHAAALHSLELLITRTHMREEAIRVSGLPRSFQSTRYGIGRYLQRLTERSCSITSPPVPPLALCRSSLIASGLSQVLKGLRPKAFWRSLNLATRSDGVMPPLSLCVAPNSALVRLRPP
jgi:hypothetical protein